MNNEKDSCRLLAAKPQETERITKIDEHEFRDKFQRDRDSILYSNIEDQFFDELLKVVCNLDHRFPFIFYDNPS